MDGYDIGEVIGRGGMGVVYRGLHTGLDRPVAVKFLSETLSGDPEFAGRFLREARICAKLDHPGIVRVYDTGTDAGRPYIVMELLEGETLRQRIKRGPMPEEEALAVARHVLAALANAHALGIVHRDIKPGNVFLCRSGAVKVMDFGIARAATEARLTGTGAQLGTPEYMSPEQVEGKTADHRSDLYAVGILLYEMLTGDVPFRGDTPIVILHMQVAKPPPQLPSTVSKRVRAGVMKALAKRPEERFASAEEMFHGLDPQRVSDPRLNVPLPGRATPAAAATGATPALAETPSGPVTRGATTTVTRSPRTLVLAGVGAVALLLAGGAINNAMHPSTGSNPNPGPGINAPANAPQPPANSPPVNTPVNPASRSAVDPGTRPAVNPGASRPILQPEGTEAASRKAAAAQEVGQAQGLLNDVDSRIAKWQQMVQIKRPTPAETARFKQEMTNRCLEALRHATRAIELDPDNVTARVVQVKGYYIAAEKAKAKAALNQALVRFPGNAELLEVKKALAL